MSEDCLDEHYVVVLIIFLVRRNRVNWPRYSSIISAGVRGTRLRAWSASGHSRRQGSMVAGAAGFQVFLLRLEVLQSC